MQEHTCLRCGEGKAEDDFYPSTTRKVGITSTCKSCINWENSRRAQGLEVPPRRNGLDGLRRCRICGSRKQLEAFAIRDKSKGTRRTECLECAKRLHREHYHANRDRRRDSMRRALYGLDPGSYDAMSAQQGGVCAICGEEETSPDRRTGEPRGLFVDHCHGTGVVRGLLCMRCNMGVGQFRDRVDLLGKAIEYLNKQAM